MASLTVDDHSSEFFTAVETLEPLLPYIHAVDDSGMTYHLQSFASVYTQTMGTTQLSNILLNLNGLLN